MARSVKPSKRGKTAKFYAKNAESRAKHSKDNSNGGKYDKPKSYQREHMKAQRALGTQGTNKDVVKKNGKWTSESMKINRARGGAKRA